MELRNKLLLYFIGLVLLTLAAFGFSIYQVARDDTLHKDLELLNSLVLAEVNEISEEYQSSHSIEHVLHHFTGQSSEDHIWLLFDKTGKMLTNHTSDKGFDKFITSSRTNEILNTQDNSGYYTFLDKLYFWAKANLSEPGYTAIHIHTPKYSARDYYNKLATRLIVVALIIFWIAVWAALIISTVITRKIKSQQKEIEYQASHDLVTGLQNRGYLTNKINNLIDFNKSSPLAVIIIGINRFREINNTLGHDFGDLLLKEFGTRLQQEFWSNDTIARFGSDQYALLVPLSDQTHWTIVTEKIENILDKPFSIQDINIITDISIGISIYPDHGNTAAILLRSAEVAMYAARKSGKIFELYDQDKDPNSIDRLQLATELNFAIEKKELELHFQPKISINNTRVIGCEALLRWKNPARGFIPPDKFIPLAEQSSIIKDLTRWVVDEAVKQCAEWHHAGKTISVSVNISARLLIDEEIITIIAYSLVKHGLQAEYLVLEITESAIIIDPVRAKNIIEKVRSMGVHLSIDDFGTGYTSISQIRSLPVSEIKIDKSFVFNILTNTSDKKLVKLIIDMAHSIEHTVTAEGIENQETLNELKSMGCDMAQGYHISRPLPLDKFREYLFAS